MDPAVLAFALVAGAVAAVNPCGFALLPAYLGLLVAGEQAGAVPRALPFADEFFDAIDEAFEGARMADVRRQSRLHLPQLRQPREHEQALGRGRDGRKHAASIVNVDCDASLC